MSKTIKSIILIFIITVAFFIASISVIKAVSAPTDPKWDSWSENVPAGNNWGHKFIKLPTAWDISKGSNNIKIGVVDGGFDNTQEDLIQNITYINPINFLQSHGTHVVGIIGARAENNTGISGIIWDSSLELYSAAVPNPSILSDKDYIYDIFIILTSMKTAIKHGVKVINFSVGADYNKSEATQKLNNSWKERLFNWVENNNYDVLFIFAAGNSYRPFNNTSPASLSSEYDNVISVAAIDKNGNLADFINEEGWGSNYGDVTVAAPGAGIYSTLPGNQYGYASGTSMAAPFVSGLAGLIYSRAEELGKTLTAAEVKDIIMLKGLSEDKIQYAVDPKGHKIPIINAYESLKLLEPQPPEPPTPPTGKAPWQTFGYDDTRASQSMYNGPATNNIKWTYSTGTIWNSSYFGIVPVVSIDGTVYIGNETEGVLYALKSDGTFKWVFSDNGASLGQHLSAPSIADDGTIYIGSSKGVLYAINPDGTEKWRYILDTAHWVGTPAVDENGNVYFTSTYPSVDGLPNYLYSIAPNGTENWKYQIENFSGIAHTAIGPDGTIYSSSIYTYSYNDLLYAVLPNGKLKWKKFYRPGTSPVVGSDGTIYFKNVYLGLEAVNPDDGSLKWYNRLHPKLKPSVSKNNIIIVDDSTGLYALNPNGTEKWKNDQIGSVYNSSATIGDDGTVYIATNLGLFALDINDGSIKWKIDGISATSPAIGPNGTLYAGWNYNIYAIGE